jgi:hypothetical protein
MRTHGTCTGLKRSECAQFDREFSQSHAKWSLVLHPVGEKVITYDQAAARTRTPLLPQANIATREWWFDPFVCDHCEGTTPKARCSDGLQLVHSTAFLISSSSSSSSSSTIGLPMYGPFLEHADN